jgi:DNA-binding NarL/FixJ family response regulator
MIKVGIIEDNEFLRGSLCNLFDNTEGLRCVLSLNNLLNINSEISKTQPDILLMDIGLPNISGIEGVRMVKTLYPGIQVMMFTVFEDNDKIFDAIKSGASGYMLKKTPAEDIIEAIRELYNGGAPMSASIARKVLLSFQREPEHKLDSYLLTPRELEVLYGLVDGLSYKKIADKHFVSISTVRTHICNIYQKLHVNSRAQAVNKVTGGNLPQA